MRAHPISLPDVHVYALEEGAASELDAPAPPASRHAPAVARHGLPRVPLDPGRHWGVANLGLRVALQKARDLPAEPMRPAAAAAAALGAAEPGEAMGEGVEEAAPVPGLGHHPGAQGQGVAAIRPEAIPRAALKNQSSARHN